MPEPVRRTRSRLAAEELLAHEAAAGDRAALEALARTWHPRLLRHARVLGLDGAGAADAVQEAWMAIVRGLPRLADPDRFGPWALRIVTRRAADRGRAAGRERRALERSGRGRAGAPPEADSGDALRAAIDGLDHERRALLLLVYVDGLALAQVAEVLGVPVGTVKSRLHHARAELRAVIERTES